MAESKMAIVNIHIFQLSHRTMHYFATFSSIIFEKIWTTMKPTFLQSYRPKANVPYIG